MSTLSFPFIHFNKKALGKDHDGVHLADTLRRKDFRVGVERLGRYLDDRINREATR
jgi:hypothetical protein